MNRSLDLGDGRIAIDQAELVCVRAQGTIEVGRAPVSTSIEVPGIRRSNWIEAWIDKDWICLVGLEGPEVVVACPARPSVAVAGELARLDMAGGYDPGGFHRVVFHPLRTSQSLIIEFEHGVARLDATAPRLVWQKVHGDVTCRVADLDDDFVWLVGEDVRFAYRLEDGRYEVAGSSDS